MRTSFWHTLGSRQARHSCMCLTIYDAFVSGLLSCCLEAACSMQGRSEGKGAEGEYLFSPILPCDSARDILLFAKSQASCCSQMQSSCDCRAVPNGQYVSTSISSSAGPDYLDTEGSYSLFGRSTGAICLHGSSIYIFKNVHEAMQESEPPLL